MAGALLLSVGCTQAEGQELTWDQNFEQSLEQAKQEQKPTLVFFKADWCTYCDQLEQDMESNPRLQQELAKYNLVEVDVDEEEELARTYSAESLPTLVILDKKGLTVRRIQGYAGEKGLREDLKDIVL